MARFICTCGQLLSNSLAPNDVQLRVYTDKEWDNILQKECINTWEIPLPVYDVWKCTKCKRLYVFEEGSDTPVYVYVLENN